MTATSATQPWPQLMETLIRTRGRRLFGYAFVLTGSAADAEDLVQTALIKVFSRVRGLSSVDAADAYMRRTMRSLVIDDKRRHRHTREVYGLEVDAAATAQTGLVDTGESLARALATLPARERVCLVMRFLDDLPMTDIAAQLGVAPATVRKYVFDGVRTLGANAEALGLSPDMIDDDSAPHIPVLAYRPSPQEN